MLFVTGNPNLVGYTRDLVRDPSGAPRTYFSDQQIKDQLNVSYLELYELARSAGMGRAIKTAYDDPVAGQISYSKPADMVELRSAELELTGGDLSSLAPSAASIRKLTPVDYLAAWEEYQSQNLSEPRYVALEGGVAASGQASGNIAILAPPAASAVGTNALRFIYDASATLLSADGDEPVLPRPYHDTICLHAASTLLLMIDQPNDRVERRSMMRTEKMLATIGEEMWEPDVQFVTAGLDDQTEYGRMGTVDWGGYTDVTKVSS